MFCWVWLLIGWFSFVWLLLVVCWSAYSCYWFVCYNCDLGCCGLLEVLYICCICLLHGVLIVDLLFCVCTFDLCWFDCLFGFLLVIVVCCLMFDVFVLSAIDLLMLYVGDIVCVLILFLALAVCCLFVFGVLLMVWLTVFDFVCWFVVWIFSMVLLFYLFLTDLRFF